MFAAPSFYDIGFAEPRLHRTFGDPAISVSDVGFGVRLDLPIGPIRIDYGIPIQKDGNGSERQDSISTSVINFERMIATCSLTPFQPTLLHSVYEKTSLSRPVRRVLLFPWRASPKALKIGTVDMNRAFKEYNKTKDAEAKINDAKNAAKKEFDDRADAYKKALDEINKLNQQLDAPALSADAKTQKAKERDEKISNIKNMEREINEFRQTREQQLQEQAMRMREGIVKEITDVVMDKVKTNNWIWFSTNPA